MERLSSPPLDISMEICVGVLYEDPYVFFKEFKGEELNLFGSKLSTSLSFLCFHLTKIFGLGSYLTLPFC